MFSLWLVPAPTGAWADIILETALLGADPQPAAGVAGSQWIGARFSLDTETIIDAIGANIQGVNMIFGAIVPIDGPGGLPSMPPNDIESYALGHVVFEVQQAVSDVTVPLPLVLGPGDYGVVFGVGEFGSSGGANLTDGNIPTSQASFFAANTIAPDDGWVEGDFLPQDLRIFVTGRRVVPEPSTLGLLACGAGLIGLVLHRRLRARELRLIEVNHHAPQPSN
jgi:hypothetical protein